jgi:hypothetical protein
VLRWDATLVAWVNDSFPGVESVSPTGIGVPMVNPPYDSTPTIKSVQAGDNINVVDNTTYVTIDSTATVTNTAGAGEPLVINPGPNPTVKTINGISGVLVSADADTIYLSSATEKDQFIPNFNSFSIVGTPSSGTISLSIAQPALYIKIYNRYMVYYSVSVDLTVPAPSNSVLFFKANVPAGTANGSTIFYVTDGSGISVQARDAWVQYFSTTFDTGNTFSFRFTFINGSTATTIYPNTQMNFCLVYDAI